LKQPTERRRKHVTTLIALAALTTILGITNTAAYAKGAVEHLHTGQKIANAIQAATGLPDLAVLAIISALPVVELRGAVPVGIWMGYPISTVFPVCVLGNIAPIIPLLVLLRNESLRKLLKPVLDRAEKKTSELGIGSIQKQWTSLAAFVGIPLPGTVSKTCEGRAFRVCAQLTFRRSFCCSGIGSLDGRHGRFPLGHALPRCSL
jgi:uncharacterized membrane protein